MLLVNLLYFVNKLRYAKEGAKDIVDSTCSDLPWQVSLEVDGKIVEIPEDAEGVLVLNIGSYMGGVDLWQNDNEYDDDFNLQLMHDKALEVVCISGTWHLGKLQVGLSQAQRLAQGNVIRLHIHSLFPVQIDGELWIQKPAFLEITHHGQENMVAIQDETRTQGLTLIQDEVVEKVLKRRSGYIQGLCVYARPTSSSRSTTTSRTFETEARLRAEMTQMMESFDSERAEMKKRLEEFLAATVCM